MSRKVSENISEEESSPPGKLNRTDLFRYRANTSFKSFLDAFLRDPSFRYIFFHRRCAFYKKHGKTWRYLFLRPFLSWHTYRFHIAIGLGCSIGPGFYIGHWGGIFINGDARIGKNCNVNQGVTIGSTNRGRRKGCPVIGDRVWIGANSVVVGKIKIGNNVMIAPGSYVFFDVPDNALVIGNPGKIRGRSGTEGYICNVV